MAAWSCLLEDAFAGIAQHDHADVLAGLLVEDARLASGRWGDGNRWPTAAPGLSRPKSLSDQGHGPVRVDVAEDGNDHVLGHEILGVDSRGKSAAISRPTDSGLATGDQVIGRGGGQVVGKDLGDLGLRIGGAIGDCPQRQAAASWRTAPGGKVGRVKHSANRAAACGKSSRSVVALPKNVKRPALMENRPPMESK